MAFDAVQEVLAQFPWLRDLGPEFYRIIVDGVQDNEPSSVIVQNIRDSDAYRSRFKGMAARREKGLPAISEAEYLETERGYLNQLRNFNVLGTLGLNSTEAFREWASEKIGGDVSVQELNARLDRGAGLARDASDFAQDAFRQFYGAPVSEDALLVYFLDEERGLDIIQDQLAAAQIGGEAFRHGLQINRTRAEILRREGVTLDLAREGFADIAREQPVLERLAEIANTDPISQQQLEEYFFHEDPDVAQKRYRIFSESLAQFQGGGARNVSRSGGLGELVDRRRTV